LESLEKVAKLHCCTSSGEIHQNTSKYIKIRQNTSKYIKIHQNTSKVKGNNVLKTHFASFLFTSKPLLFPKRMQQIQSRQAPNHGAKFLHRPTRPLSQHRFAGGRPHRRRFGAAQVPRSSRSVAPSGSGGILPCQEALLEGLEAHQATAPTSQHSCHSQPNTSAPH
jgi:hypothetical protein